MKKTSIVIAEDHTILREGLQALLSGKKEFNVVGEAKDGREAIHSVEENKPDIILLDLSMPRMNGLEAIQEIKKRSVNTKILVLTVHKTEEYVLASLEAGADGYILKEATHSELLIAINNVLSGKPYLSPGISEKVIEGYLSGKNKAKNKGSQDRLTKREREILKLIAEGHTNKRISEILCISIKTVEKHRSNVMGKLDIHNVSALTLYAVEKGIVSF